MEACAHRDAFHHITYHARTAARGNDGVDTGTARHVRGLELGAHTACPKTRNTVSRNGTQRIVNAVNVFDQFCLWIGTRVSGKQPLLIGQKQQLIGPCQDRRQRREVIVVAYFDFSGGNSVVFIDDRNDMVIQQRAQRIEGVQETFSVFHIRTRQQHLPDVNAINGEQLFPELYESALSYGGQQLFGGDRRGEFGVAQVFTPGGNRPGGHNHNTMPCGMQLSALTYKLNDMGTIKAARSAC